MLVSILRVHNAGIWAAAVDSRAGAGKIASFADARGRDRPDKAGAEGATAPETLRQNGPRAKNTLESSRDEGPGSPTE
ncbi:hypothetical protein GCM10007276_10250 [Agaricicola taiwanensis]|uniref:Uncharacterized protein n=1 Tax=Agaricicola taiwanensis TaxID=591372 RepID=A0A8J2YBW2_9RHOB|nr:hypothetical protein GCM10007276_10250 [Agaricicola taiwanensis]